MQPLTLTYGVVASDLGIFELLAKSDKPLTVASLAETQKCDPVLMGEQISNQRKNNR